MSNARELIDRYFDLAPQPDADAYFAQFAADAVVEDEGQAHRGIAAIRAWRSKVPRVAYTVQDVKATSTGHDADATLPRACSSSVRFGEISPVSMSEGRAHQ